MVQRGAGYAALAADLLGMADLVEGCFDKRRGPEVPVDFTVDGEASMVKAHGGYRIAPFDGDLSSWEFCVVPTKVINRELDDQKTVGHNRIRSLTKPVTYSRLRDRVDEALVYGWSGVRW